MRICPNNKFIEIFSQRFHYLEDLFYKFFALNLLFQDTSYSLALKYSSFLFKFFSFAFYNINFWFKISKICPKILHFFQISRSTGNTATINSLAPLTVLVLVMHLPVIRCGLIETSSKILKPRAALLGEAK